MAIDSKKVKVFLGTGGVGKTTLASLYALKLSEANPSKKVKLITIDPSKRLKDYFGMSVESEDQSFYNLTVSMKKRENLLKEFITEAYTGDEKKVEKTYSNKIFQKLIGGLAVSQEFTSLYEIYKSKRDGYDFLIIDTPPLQNAGAFLNGADELEGLFSSSLMKFFMPPSEQGLLYRLFYKAQQKSFEVLSKLTGAAFVRELADFFTTVDFVRPKILDVISYAKRTLETGTEVYCVCNYNELSLAGLKLSIVSLSKQCVEVEKSYINKYIRDVEPSNAIEERLEGLFGLSGEDHFKMIDRFAKEPTSYKDLLELGEKIEF